MKLSDKLLWLMEKVFIPTFCVVMCITVVWCILVVGSFDPFTQ